MRSQTGLATTAVARRLAARRGALAATAAVTLAAAYFAVRVAVAWEVSLPHAVQDDLHASPDAAIVATTNATSAPPSCAGGAGAMPGSVRAAVGSGGFTADAMTISDSLSLSSLPGLAPDSFVKAYCAHSVRDHAVLTQGRWPGPDGTAAGGEVPVAVPVGTLTALKLHVGSTLALTDAVTRARVSLRVVGAFQRTRDPAAYWTWDSVGSSGAQVVGSYTIYDPVVADASAFRSGALHADSATLLVLPPTADGSAAGLSRISAQASSITASLSGQSNPFYALSGALAADVDALGAGVVTVHAQLLAACLLLGAVTAAGLIAAAGLLVGVGAGQSALVRARGAGRRHLLAAHSSTNSAQMSGGEQQRTAIATALANTPRVLLADEPTGELDSETAETVFEGLRTANREHGVTVLIVTHDAAISGQVQRTVAIRDGRTSTETLMRGAAPQPGTHAAAEAFRAVEYAVIDRVGRLQLPREFTEFYGLRDRVRLTHEPGHVGVWPDLHETQSPQQEPQDANQDGGENPHE